MIDLTFTFRQNKSLLLFMPRFISENDTSPSNTNEIGGLSDLKLVCSHSNEILPGTAYTGIRTFCSSIYDHDVICILILCPLQII